MALGDRGVRRRAPSLEQSGKAEQKTQDDGAENVSAGERLPAHLQPRTNLAAGPLPGASVGELAALGLFAELIKSFLPIYFISVNEDLGAGPRAAARCSLEPTCPCRHQGSRAGLSWASVPPATPHKGWLQGAGL